MSLCHLGGQLDVADLPGDRFEAFEDGAPFRRGRAQ